MLFSKLVSPSDDPLSKQSAPDNFHDGGSSTTTSVTTVKTESLTIRLSDELRIVNAMSDAAKGKTSGTIFSVRVDVSKATSLCIGVKDLQDKLLTVSMLKRINGVIGPVETAGMRLGDIIFGINFQPCRDGSKTLLQAVKNEMDKKRKTIHIQCWRCKQLCSDPPPGALFPRADTVIVQAYSMVRTKVFSDWERWNFIEILLEYMVDDLKTRYKSNNSERIVAQLRILDLEHNILQAKGLRTALCVRIVHTKLQSDAVIYVLRVEDVETGLQWVVHRRYRDFAALNEELSDMSHFTRDIPFPRKRFTNSNNPRVVEERIIALEQYARRVLHVLTLYATMDPLASRSLRHFQNFVGVDRYIDCIHPPVVDDQRCIELLAYRILNDFSSPACQQCIRFVGAVDLESLVEDGPNGYKPMLKHLSLALAEVEAFVLENHMAEMLRKLAERKPQYTAEQSRVFVRRCVRRQVEASIFLPLRRTVFRIVYSFVAVQAQCMHRAMGLLQQAAPDYFEVDPYILQTGAMPRAIKAFRDVIQAYLPADQGQLLMHAAAAVMQLHSECSAHGGSKKKKKSVPDQDSEAESIMSSSEGSGSSRGKKKSISIQDAIRERESIHSNGDGGDMYDSSHREAAYAIPTATNMKIKAMSTNINSSGSRSGSASSLGISGPKGGRIKVAGTTSTTSSVTTPTNGGTANGDIDFTSKATIADPVGTIFHSFETSHTNAPISRKSSVNGHDTDDSRHKTNSVDHNTNGSKAMGNNHNRIVSTGAIDSSQAASRVIAKHDSRSKDDDHNDRNDEGSGLTFSPSAAAFLPSPVRSNSDLELMANEEKESIGCADSESSVDSRPHGKSSENYFTAEDCRTYGGDLDSPDKGSESGQDEDAETCEESTLKKRVLNDKLKSLSLVPETPNPSASFGDLDSTDKEDIAGDGLGRESVSLKTLRESVEDKRRILFPPEDSMQPPLRAPNAKTEFRKLESNSSENNEGIDTASADAYFTAEENMVIEEAWQGREYVSETVNTNNSATLSLAAAADLFRATLTGGGGNNTERFGDDSKMTATTTTQFFDSSATEQAVVSADDFLPMFTFVLVQASLPQLLLVKEIMTSLVDDEETFGECGYYLATLEAATQHIVSLAEQFEDFDKASSLFSNELLPASDLY